MVKRSIRATRWHGSGNGSAEEEAAIFILPLVVPNSPPPFHCEERSDAAISIRASPEQRHCRVASLLAMTVCSNGPCW